MNSLKQTLFSILTGLIMTETSFASTDATCLIYQPIDMRSEGTVIKLPQEGFMILAVPYLSGFSVPEKPYDAITRPYRMLSMRKNPGEWDSNLVSRTGVQIQSVCTFTGNKFKKEVVTVDFSKFRTNEYDPSLDVIAAATLECIRRMATDVHQNWPRPVLKIIGKPADKAKWRLWVEAFNKQDFSKPFKCPRSNKQVPEVVADQPAIAPESKPEVDHNPKIEPKAPPR